MAVNFFAPASAVLQVTYAFNPQFMSNLLCPHPLTKMLFCVHTKRNGAFPGSILLVCFLMVCKTRYNSKCDIKTMTLQIVSFPRPQPVLLFCSCLFKCILPVSLSIVVSKELKLSLFHSSYWWAVGCRFPTPGLLLRKRKEKAWGEKVVLDQVGWQDEISNCPHFRHFWELPCTVFNEEMWSKHSRFCFTLCCQPHFHKWYIDQNYFVASVFHS